MNIIRAYPPNFVEIAKVFPNIKGMPGILYAWGDRIFNPSGVKVPQWLVDHEKVHGERQLRNPLEEFNDEPAPTPEMLVRVWWKVYLNSPEFRLQEEIPAHQEEWRSYKANGPRGSIDYLGKMARRLSGPLYGNLISYKEAMKLIQCP